MYSNYPYRPFYPYSNDIRQNIFNKILACYNQKRWIRLTFHDGTNVEGFIRTYDLSRGVLVYLPLGKYQIVCNGISVASIENVQNCIGKTATLTLPNNRRLTFTIEGVDQNGNIGGWLNINELLTMSAQVTDANCI